MTTGDHWDMPELTAADRCDRCGARALVRVVLLSGDLYFCGHHYHAHEVALLIHGVHVYDHDERKVYGFNVDTRQEIDEDGRMHFDFGMRSTDQCRWCCTRLQLRRAKAPQSQYLTYNYVVCPICDGTPASFPEWADYAT